MIVGLDAYKGRWVVALEHDGARTRIQLSGSLAEIAAHSEITHAVVDVPIGLLEEGTRECDRLARLRLGSRRAAVFTAPLRAMLNATSHGEASEIRRRIEGKDVSLQAFSIIPLVRSVDDVMTPKLQAKIREGPGVPYPPTASAGAEIAASARETETCSFRGREAMSIPPSE